MNQVLIDNALLAAAVLVACLLSNSLKRRKAGFIFSALLLFPPLVTFLNMWAHTVAVTIVNSKRYVAGMLEYNFTVYSLLLFGLVFIVVSGLTIHCSRKYLCGERKQKRNIYRLNLLTSLCFLPLVPLNPISALPVIAAIVSSVVLRVYNPYRIKTGQIKHGEPAQVMVS